MEKINAHIYGNTYALTQTIPLNIYMVKGDDEAVFIDSGVKYLRHSLMDMLTDTNSRLIAILNTHSHHDHIGCNASLKEATACQIIAPKACAHWHNDWEAHYQEFARPFPTIFPDSEALRDEVFGLLDAPHQVDRICEEGEIWQLGGGVELECFKFSGHMLEEVGWLEKKTKTLILGDVVTLLDVPFIHGHVDVAGYRESLTKLKKMADQDMFTKVLMAHFPPMDKANFYRLIDRAQEYVNKLEQTILKVVQSGTTELEKIWLQTIETLDKQEEFRSLSTVYAHLKDLEKRGLISFLPNHEISYHV
ncbi:MAG: MBL fold metallo-hydrolase [Bacteroidota bacterium]